MGQKQGGARVKSGRSIEENHVTASSPQGHPSRKTSLPPGPPHPGIIPWGVPLPTKGNHPAMPNGYNPPRSSSSKKSSKSGQGNGRWVPAQHMPPPMFPPHRVMMGRGGTPLYYPVPPHPLMYSPPPGMGYPGGPHPFGYPRFFDPAAQDMGPSDDQIPGEGTPETRQETNQISTHADVIATDPDKEINNNDDDKDDGEDRDESSDKVVGGQTIVPESLKQIFSDATGTPGMLPAQLRQAHFVTFLNEEPDPASPPTPPATPDLQPEAKELHAETQSSLHLVYAKVREGFVEVGESEGPVIRHLIDADPSQQQTTDLPGERIPLSVHRVQVPDSSLEEQTVTLTLTDTPPADVVVCYDTADAGLATVLQDELQDSQLTVYMSQLSPGVTSDEDLASSVRAVFKASTLVVLLSPTSARHRHVRDLVSLATLTHRAVLPVAVGSRSNIVQLLDIELKLQLSRCQWTELALTGGVVLDGGLGELVIRIREQMDALRKYDVIDEDYGQVSSWAVRHQRAMRVDRQKDVVRIVSRLEGDGDSLREEGEGEGQGSDSLDQEVFVMAAAEFWDKTFPQNSAVPWDKFRAQLRSHYMVQFSTQLPRSCMDRLMKALRESLVQRDSKGTEYTRRDSFIAFCSDNGVDIDVWQAICDVARHCQAVIDVFAKDSTIRIAAVEGIASHGSPTVVSGLRELLQDTDPQLRSLAVEVLCRCNVGADATSLAGVMAALGDAHWMVRKVACEGMARLGAPQAVDRLRRLGHTDQSAHVRAAAASAVAEIEAGLPHTATKPPV